MNEMNELADARTFQGANAQTPTTTANICPRKMLTHLGKSEARSLADEMELSGRGGVGARREGLSAQHPRGALHVTR